MNIASPFSQNRFEYEGRHFYYLPRQVFSDLQTAKPKYLVGSRGSGKTTLLKALCWDEQITNESLRRQLGSSFLDGQCIGTYVKLPSIQLRLLDSWLHSADDDVYGAVFAFYLDLVGLQLFAEALAGLRAKGVFVVPVPAEHEAVRAWISKCPSLLRDEKVNMVPSLPSFADAVAATRKSVERAALQKESPAHFAARLDIGPIGNTGAAVAPLIGLFCDEVTASPPGTWHLKICMDEGEALSGKQHRILRTAMRVAQWPLFPIVSFVRLPEDRSSTEFHALTLQAADRDQVILDRMDKAAFKEFAEGVATIRCQALAKSPDAAFDIYRLLGSLDLNRILQDILNSSESPLAHQLLSSAKTLAASGFNDRSGNSVADVTVHEDAEEVPDRGKNASPPIWQAYLMARLNLQYPSADRATQRHFESINLRKKMVAAFLSICKELRTPARYASADMVLEISDNCIRDFLAQMDELFKGIGKSIEGFLQTPVSYEVQYRAIIAASKKKRDSLPVSGVAAPVYARRIVDALAQITAMLHSATSGERHLSAPERGQFAVELTESQVTQYRELIDLIYDTADAGFLRIVDDHETEPKFRVHTSLAPTYGFSYRGAYFETWIKVEDLEDLRNQKSDDRLRTAATALFDRIAREEPRPLLEEQL